MTLEVVILSMELAVMMAIIGTPLMNIDYPVGIFDKYDLALPSCLTWLILMWWLRNSSWKASSIIGLSSPFLGAALMLTLSLGPARDMTFWHWHLSEIENITKPLGTGVIQSVAFVLLYGFVTLCKITRSIGAIFWFAGLYVFLFKSVTFPMDILTASLIRGVWTVAKRQ